MSIASESVHLRPAQVGDVCVLLEPTDRHEIDRTRHLQAALQRCFGGTPIERLHLTCQRFAWPGEGRLRAVIDGLTPTLAACTPPTLTAVSLDTLFVPVLDTLILKWRVQVTEPLRELSAALERLLQECGLDSLYVPGFVSSLLAALKDVPRPDLVCREGHAPGDDEILQAGLPCELFTARQVVLSQILGADEFEILATLQFADRPGESEVRPSL